MHYCTRCRVFIEEDIEKCPLCHRPLELANPEADDSAAFSEGRLPTAEEQQSFWTQKVQRDRKALSKIALGGATLALITLTLILVAADLSAYNRTGVFVLSTLKAIISSLFAYGVIALFYFTRFKGRGFWFLTLWISLFLLGLDLSDGRIDWAVRRGLPLTWGFCAPGLALAASWYNAKIKGFNILGFLCLGLAFGLVFLDLGFSAKERLLVSGWSLITFGVLTGAALFFFYWHYSVKSYIHLDRILRLKRPRAES